MKPQRLFTELKDSEKKIAFEKNVEKIINDAFKEEREEVLMDLNEKVREFAEKWRIENGNIEFEIDNYLNVNFYSGTTEYDLEDIEYFIQSYQTDLHEKKVIESIEFCEDLSSLTFFLDIQIDSNEVQVVFQEDFKLANYLTKEQMDKRLNVLFSSENETFAEAISSYKLKHIFNAKSEDDYEQIDSLLRECYYTLMTEKTDWVQKLNKEIDGEFQTLKKEIEREAVFLESDDFYKQQLEKSKEIYFDEELNVIEWE